MTLPKNPRAVVTGGGGGLGRAFALELARRGAKIVIADVDLAGAEETAHLVAGAGGEAHAVRCDVSKAEEMERVAAEAEKRFGGTDLIVNNAGVAVAGGIDQIPLADWEWIMGINLWGVIHGCRTFVPRFRKQGSGHIVNVASAAGLLSAANMAPYNVTKAGVIALSETLFAELADAKIGVTVLCPTFFRTKIASSGRTHGDAVFLMDKVAVKLMDRSKIQAADVARLALEGADRGQLYVVPMSDGKLMWRLKRIAPQQYYSALAPRIMAVAKRFG